MEEKTTYTVDAIPYSTRIRPVLTENAIYFGLLALSATFPSKFFLFVLVCFSPFVLCFAYIRIMTIRIHVHEISIGMGWIEVVGHDYDKPFQERFEIKDCLMSFEGGGNRQDIRYSLVIKHKDKAYNINYDRQWDERVFLDFYRKFRDQRRDGIMEILYDSDLKFIENRLLGMSITDAQNTK